MKKSLLHYSSILFLINLCVIRGQVNYYDVLEAQFLNLEDEVKIATNGETGEKIEKVLTQEASQKEWYKVMISLNTPRLEDQWLDLKQAQEIRLDSLEHKFQELKLSEAVPFYGRYINNVILTTGGGLLTSMDINDSLQIPSYIAPFLTALPASDRDTLIFNDTLDKGGEFVLQWDKHHGPDDKNLRLQVQLRILLDGTLSFLYKNFGQAILDVIDDKGYPLSIGLRDGFSAINSNATKERTVYYYPDYTITPDQLVNHPLGLVTLAPIEGLCKTKAIDECTNECTRCQNECLYNMELHRSGSACNVKEECHAKCPQTYEPICGEDGTTYSNQCNLQYQACFHKTQISVRHQGECQIQEENTDNCGACTKEYKPICGSDNVTYVNECILKQTNCQKGTQITKSNEGPCALIQFIEDGSDNEDDDQEDPEDICEKNCDDAMQPVCINGNRSFGNRCQMEVAICKEGIDAKSIKNGKCPDCSSKGCSDEEDFVCGTNEITYKNECILQKVACEKLTENLEVKHYGKCESENEIDPCEPLCPRHLMPVCGTDGQTYNNDCLLKAATCRDKSIVQLHSGACDPEKMEIAAQIDKELSDSAKMEHNGEDSPQVQSASGTRLGLAAILTVAVICGLMYAGYSYRKRRQMRNIPAPMTFSISEFHDEEEGEVSSAGVSNENWRRPSTRTTKYDRTNLVENMDS